MRDVDSVIVGRSSRRPAPAQLDSVYQATVLSSTSVDVTVELDDMPGRSVGPAPFPGSTQPPDGTRCVVAFSHGALKGAVVLTFLGWP